MFCRIIFLAIFSFSLSPLPSGNAAEFRVIRPCTNECDAYIYVIGKIEPGDGARFRQVVKATGPSIDSLFLRSPGGSMYDSIQIGTLTHELMLDTYAPQTNCGSDDNRFGINNAPCTCLSGCFLIWMGGVNRYGVTIGMHRPWDQSGNMGQLKYDRAAAMYNKWIEDLKAYLVKMELPDSYFAKFIATVRSGDMRMLTNADLLSLNNNPSKVEWLSSRCGEYPANKTELLGQLSQSKFAGRPYNVALWQQLSDEYNAVYFCKKKALRDTRAAVFSSL